jgi:hypothetical protein
MNRLPTDMDVLGRVRAAQVWKLTPIAMFEMRAHGPRSTSVQSFQELFLEKSSICAKLDGFL